MKGGISKRAAEQLHWQAVRRYVGMWKRAQDEREKATSAPKEKNEDNQGELKL